jgi:hypothetical protein
VSEFHLAGEPLCFWCQKLPPMPNGKFCSRKCRQSSFRARRRRTTVEAAGRPMRMAYFDPPYPNLARKYYQHEPSYAGEVDHPALIASAMEAGYDGWALSTSARALRELLPLCPTDVRVCPWVKPIGVPPATNGLHNAWEALLVVGGRQRPPGRRDWLAAQPARHGGTLPGRKPAAFYAFLFDSLGMLPGDDLFDAFPGTGGVARAWAYVSSLRQGPTPFEESARYLSDGSVDRLHDGGAELVADIEDEQTEGDVGT